MKVGDIYRERLTNYLTIVTFINGSYVHFRKVIFFEGTIQHYTRALPMEDFLRWYTYVSG